jgi:hypothetical protein
VQGLASLLELSRQGILTPDTLVFDEEEHRWRPARELAGHNPAEVPPSPLVIEHIHSDPGYEATDTDTERTKRKESVTALSQVQVPKSQMDIDRGCLRVARILWGVNALAIVGVIVAIPNGDAAEAFGKVLVYAVAGAIGCYFTLRNWGRGRALLIASVLLLLFSGYFLTFSLVARSRLQRKAEVTGSALADVSRHAQTFSREIQGLKIEETFAVLDGKRPYSRATLEQLRSNVGVAERKTTTYLEFFRNRAKQASRELSAIDSSAGNGFAKSLDASFPGLRAAYSAQAGYFAAINRLLTFLLDESGPFEITAKGISFESSRDNNVYNLLIDQLNGYAANVNRLKADLQHSK